MRLIITMLAVALTVGCSDSTEPAIINGTYPLRAARGDPLPATIRDEPNYTMRITGGTITLNGDLTFTDSFSIWEYRAGVITTSTLPCTGTWAPSSERFFTLQEAATPNCGDSGTGEWDGRDRVTIAWNAFGTMTYRR